MSVITLGHESFTVPTSKQDSLRRQQYFRTGSGSLTKEEEAILEALGIDESMQQSLRPYMSDFFDALPDCSSDTSLILNKKCEVPYYVIWSTQFANRQALMERIATDPHTTRPDYENAHDYSVLQELKPHTSSSYDSVFTLIVSASAPAKTTTPTPTLPTPAPLPSPSTADIPTPNIPAQNAYNYVFRLIRL